MHYGNGRPANNGDKVILFSTYGAPIIGILYNATAGNDTCNGNLAACAPNDPCPNLKDCLHYDDVAAVRNTIPDLTAPPVTGGTEAAPPPPVKSTEPTTAA